MLKVDTLAEHTIKCADCGHIERVCTRSNDYLVNDTPQRFFKRKGWSDKHQVVLCPDCTRIRDDQVSTNSCKTCVWLYIKDFVFGICTNPNTLHSMVNPEESCSQWKERSNL